RGWGAGPVAPRARRADGGVSPVLNAIRPGGTGGAPAVRHASEVEPDAVHRQLRRRAHGNRPRPDGQIDPQLIAAVALGVARVEEVERLARLPHGTVRVDLAALVRRGRA